MNVLGMFMLFVMLLVVVISRCLALSLPIAVLALTLPVTMIAITSHFVLKGTRQIISSRLWR